MTANEYETANISFGVVLPHFGPHASGERIRQAATAADRAGFDSVWVRDHLVFHPHPVEPDDPTFVDGFLTLSHAAAVTRKVELGTAAAIPIRHPLRLAQTVASLAFISGRQFHLGLGAGHRDQEFAAVGEASTLKERAEQVIPDTIAILREAWAGTVQSDRARFRFEEVDLQPKPPLQPIVWYCGTSPKALRIARRHCEGWAPGRVTFDTLSARLPDGRESLSRLAVIPLTVVDDNIDKARNRTPLDKLYDYVNKHRWIPTPNGQADHPDDLEGLLLAGPPDTFDDTVDRYRRHGVTDIIFDLRLDFADATNSIDRLGDSLSRWRNTK